MNHPGSHNKKCSELYSRPPSQPGADRSIEKRALQWMAAARAAVAHLRPAHHRSGWSRRLEREPPMPCRATTATPCCW